MGNRALITWDNKIGVYLHWDGERQTVEGLLAYCKANKLKNPSQNPYGLAAFIKIASIYSDGSIAVGLVDDLNDFNLENGLIICNGWYIDKQIIEGVELPHHLDGDTKKLVEIMEAISNKDVHSSATLGDIVTTARDYYDVPF